MNLWIRSQDKLTMILVDKNIKIIDYRGLKEKLEESPLSFLKDMEQVKPYIDKEGWGLSVDDVCLGIYESKERALEVLDEIQKYKDKLDNAHFLGMTESEFVSSIFEMTKE